MSMKDNLTSSDGMGTPATVVIHIEEHNTVYITIMTIISVTLLLFTLIALVALRRTKSTPATARFLSSGLLLFDITGTLSFTIRRFVENDHINIFVQMLGVNCVFVAYVTVGIMSFERFLIFSRPNFYLRCVTPERVRIVVTILWILLTGMNFFVRFGLCYILQTNATIYDVIGRCNGVSYMFYGVFIVVTCIVSCVCYTRIFLIERAIGKVDRPMSDTIRALVNYKTTGIVFLYTLSILFTTTAYGFILLFLKSNVYYTRIAVDIANMTSCILDPCLYVLWFRECRYEVMKMFPFSSSKLTQRLEDMRIDIFNIVSGERKNAFNNKTEPLEPNNVI